MDVHSSANNSRGNEGGPISFSKRTLSKSHACEYLSSTEYPWILTSGLPKCKTSKRWTAVIPCKAEIPWLMPEYHSSGQLRIESGEGNRPRLRTSFHQCRIIRKHTVSYGSCRPIEMRTLQSAFCPKLMQRGMKQPAVDNPVFWYRAHKRRQLL